MAEFLSTKIRGDLQISGDLKINANSYISTAIPKNFCSNNIDNIIK